MEAQLSCIRGISYMTSTTFFDSLTPSPSLSAKSPGPVDRMSHRKRRETKQEPGRARSGNQISCCLVSLHILSTGPVYYMIICLQIWDISWWPPLPFCLDIIYGSPLEWSLCTRRVGWKGRNLGAHSREAPLRRAVDRTLYNWQQPLLTPPMHNQCFVVLLVKIQL